MATNHSISTFVNRQYKPALVLHRYSARAEGANPVS